MADPQATQTSGRDGPSGSSVSDLAGSYTFRFDGFNVTNNILFSLRGLGQFKMDQNGKLSGKQRSSITQLQGQDATLQTSAYNLEGKISLDTNELIAEIDFTKTDGYGRDVHGKFYVTASVNPPRLWLISSGATLAGSNTPAVETVSVEAVRMGTS
jgi:hypothetical protein